jgi:hypothetical protein
MRTGKLSASQQRLRAHRRAAGLCIACEDLVEGQNAYCESCRVYQRERMRELYHERRARGQCTRCPRKARPGMARCTPHHKADLASKRANPSRRGA